MAALVAKAKTIIPGVSSSDHSTARQIPHEPVQRQQGGNFTSNENAAAIQAHNLARNCKSCNNLTWSSSLERDAHDYAQRLAEMDTMEHSGIEGQGENLFMSSGEATFEDATKAWLGEERSYNGEAIGEGNLADWGHFTQCLWKSTTEFGMGKARTKNGATYIVARYTPPGNTCGEKPF